MRYYVTTLQMYEQIVLVDADSPEEAAKKIRRGQGVPHGNPRYHSTPRNVYWTVTDTDGAIVEIEV